ncbi:hypothetical protein ONZ51_g12309 [Trametes cubensis]|uniref:Uncharacterized protein n=1 Tax=Trametes cubensis TaxID=1111947 RepID=A0AAD7THH1_9APHY|nr:hypothetical protein ONZ51_g12309 [Trametes cubensis]
MPASRPGPDDFPPVPADSTAYIPPNFPPNSVSPSADLIATGTRRLGLVGLAHATDLHPDVSPNSDPDVAPHVFAHPYPELQPNLDLDLHPGSYPDFNPDFASYSHSDIPSY